jgi:hypothetical protein
VQVKHVKPLRKQGARIAGHGERQREELCWQHTLALVSGLLSAECAL